MKRIIYAQQNQRVTELEKANRRLAYEAALEGIVLLKNQSVLPVPQSSRIALFGAGAVRTLMGGTGSGEVNVRGSVSIAEGLENAGFPLTAASREWLDACAARYDAAARDSAKKLSPENLNSMLGAGGFSCGTDVLGDADLEEDAELAVYVITRQAGEGTDARPEPGSARLLPEERASVKKLAERYPKTLVLINAGSPLFLNGLQNEVPALMYYCQQGMEGGNALAALISGKESPSGRLTDSWAEQYEDLPCSDCFGGLSGNARRVEYREGIYVGYRYFDSFGKEPLYPFGYGLSYTDFALGLRSFKAGAALCRLELKVKNIGVMAGKETVQLYVSPPAGRLPKEQKRLVAFGKTRRLDPGEEEILALSFEPYACASYDAERAAWVLEEGDYVLRAGFSSGRTVPCARIRLKGEALLAQLKNCAAPAQTVPEIRPPGKPEELLPEDLPLAEINAEQLPCARMDYDLPDENLSPEGRALADSLSDRECIRLCVGSGLSGMLDSRGRFSPGTVGRTTGTLMKKGLWNGNLSDGPAGLRLLGTSALGRGAFLKMVPGHFLMAFMETLPEGLFRPFKAGEGSKRLYQYPTAFPVETALAQSWNTELLERVGEAVGREMEVYGISWWLAPALNLHRNPLCGRSFEYFSEDPLLSGKCAAALTRGIQSRPGCYATLKHFACNNQEEERGRSDSCVNERTLRELYLKGFEIAVKESGPRALMTSYNQLNGCYCADRRELLTDILRCEWGFDGLVMTDWFATVPGRAGSAKALMAGNDLIMPGGSLFRLQLEAGLLKGTLSREALRRSAGRILRELLGSQPPEEQRKALEGTGARRTVSGKYRERKEEKA